MIPTIFSRNNLKNVRGVTRQSAFDTIHSTSDLKFKFFMRSKKILTDTTLERWNFHFCYGLLKMRWYIFLKLFKTMKNRAGTARYFNSKCSDNDNPHKFSKVQVVESKFRLLF